MATLADVIRKRRSAGQTRTGSLMSSLKDKFLESIDPRKFVNQTGIMTALFPSLKKFTAGEMSSNETTSKISPVSDDNQNKTLRLISKNTKIAATNYSLLPEITKEANVMEQNIRELVKKLAGRASANTDKFFLKQKETEKLYESKFDEESKIEKVEKVEKKGFNWMRFFGLVGVGVSSALIVDFLLKRENSFVYKTYESIKKEILEFSNNIKKFAEDVYDDVKIYTSKAVDIVKNTINDLLDELGKFSIKEALDDLIDPDKNIFDQFDKKIAEAKEQVSSKLEQFSFIPSAQAATLPSTFRPDQPPMVTGTQTPPITQPGQVTPTRITQTTEDADVDNLLNLIAKAEGTSDEMAVSKGFASGYDVSFGHGRFAMPEKPLTQMTIGEVKEFQGKLIQATRGKIKGVDPRLGTSAVGKYQIIRPTLIGLQSTMNISDSELFSTEIQDRMAVELLNQAGMNRVDPVTFQNNIAGVWASIPKVDGRGVYNFSGVSQPLGTTSEEVSEAISQITPRIANIRNVNEPLDALTAAVSDGEITTHPKSMKGFVTVNNNSSNVFKFTQSSISLKNPHTSMMTYVTQ